jgi:hypothetical protein
MKSPFFRVKMVKSQWYILWLADSQKSKRPTNHRSTDAAEIPQSASKDVQKNPRKISEIP